MTSIKYFTQEGYDALKEELNELKTKGRADMAKQISEAREKGDLSENAEYDAAKEAQGLLEMKISKLEGDLSAGRVMDTSKLDLKQVQVLTAVRLKNLKVNKEVTYRLVTESEANIKEGKISVSSPIGQGLLGKKVGDIAEITVPAGKIQLEILEISI